MVYIFCDNTAVVKVLSKEKPMDPRMLELLREFLYIVCTRRFTPFTPEFRKIGTSDNYIADFISRCHDHTKICNYFLSRALPVRGGKKGGAWEHCSQKEMGRTILDRRFWAKFTATFIKWAIYRTCCNFYKKGYLLHLFS